MHTTVLTVIHIIPKKYIVYFRLFFTHSDNFTDYFLHIRTILLIKDIS